MSHPDYMIIGAMKCGTTSLAAQLGTQDGLFMTDPKEPYYFSDDPVFAQGPDWYAGLFADAAPGDLTGEATTHYTKRPDYPDTIARIQAAGLALSDDVSTAVPQAMASTSTLPKPSKRDENTNSSAA